MSPDERDDSRDEALLREYLEGDSPVSRLYRRHADEQPGPALDARIREQAHCAVSPRPRAVKSPFARHWMVPASLAAVLVLSVSVVLLTPHGGLGPVPLPESVAPPAEAPRPAAAPRARSELEEDAREAVGASRLEATEAAKSRAEPSSPARKSMREAAPAPSTAADAPPAAELRAPAPAGRLADEQTVGDAAPLADDALQADPQAWLRHIERLADTGHREDALANLRAFRARYPNHPLPASLAALARALDAERP